MMGFAVVFLYEDHPLDVVCLMAVSGFGAIRDKAFHGPPILDITFQGMGGLGF
jgi:hypothetical protein